MLAVCDVQAKSKQLNRASLERLLASLHMTGRPNSVEQLCYT